MGTANENDVYMADLDTQNVTCRCRLAAKRERERKRGTGQGCLSRSWARYSAKRISETGEFRLCTKKTPQIVVSSKESLSLQPDNVMHRCRVNRFPLVCKAWMEASYQHLPSEAGFGPAMRLLTMRTTLLSLENISVCIKGCACCQRAGLWEKLYKLLVKVVLKRVAVQEKGTEALERALESLARARQALNIEPAA